MLLLLFVLFLVAVVAELYVIVQVAQWMGALETVLALVVIAIFGVWVVRRAGMVYLARAFAQLSQGRAPTDEMINGGVVLVAGGLLFVPGFLSDAVGIALLLPPVRAGVRRVVRGRVRRRVESGRASGFAVRFGSRFGPVVDADGRPVTRPPQPPAPKRELE